MYCPNPFERMEIKADGSVYCCCEGWLPTPLGNILVDSFEEIWNGPVAAKIRQSILNQSFSYCLTCPYLPAGGGSVVAETPATPPTELIHTLKLDYDQSCNLTCPSCRVTHSKNFVDVPKVLRIHEAMIASGVLTKTLRLYVTGAGDPFASDLYWNFLLSVPRLEHHKNTSIFLHTNGLLFDRAHWDELGETRKMVTEVGISVDAARPETYKTNRGASWWKLWNNIAFINDLQAEGHPLMMGMFYTVQDNNFREIVPFIRMAFNHRASWISITALRNWGTYTPAEFEKRAVHLPGHPNHAEFKAVVSDPLVANNRRIILDSFNPEYTWQQHTINPGAILSPDVLRRTQKRG
jgi:radical SAM protein with 4Fe4S-binding SPASM domain